MWLPFILKLQLLSSVWGKKINAPDCSSFVGQQGAQPQPNRKLYIAACESKWGPEVQDAYKLTASRMIDAARTKGNLEIVNVCANLNWKKMGFLTKPMKYLEYSQKILKEVTDAAAFGGPSKVEHAIIFSDSDTFWSINSTEAIFQKYDCVRKDKHIVMATETSCWVGRYCIEEDINRYYKGSSAPSYSAFINSGLLMGSPAALVQMFSYIVQNNRTAMIPKYMGALKYDDQLAFVQFYINFKDLVMLDYHQELFGSIVTSHKSERNHTIPFRCVRQDSPDNEDWYDYHCDDYTRKALRRGALKLDMTTCEYVRNAEILRDFDPLMYEVYRTLSTRPAIWHGNGAGKSEFLNLRPKLASCYGALSKETAA